MADGNSGLPKSVVSKLDVSMPPIKNMILEAPPPLYFLK